jgi:hypothetical protein
MLARHSLGVRSMSRAVFLAVLLSSTAALADEPAYPPPLPVEDDEPPPQTPYPAQVPYTPAPVYAPQYQYAYPAPAEGPKSAWTAGMLSLAATVAPPLLATMVYGNRSENEREDVVGKIALASVMIGPSVGHIYAGKFLTIGLGVRVAGFAVAMSATQSDDLGDALGRIMIGGILLASGAIADLATVGKSVNEYNAEHARIVPTVTPVMDPNGSIRPQVGLAGRF